MQEDSTQLGNDPTSQSMVGQQPSSEQSASPQPPVQNASAQSGDMLSTIKKYWWVPAIIIALLAVLSLFLVIPVLMWINPYKAPEQCIFDQAGFVCARPILMSNGELYATIVNGYSKSVNIAGIYCVKGRTPPSGDLSKWGEAQRFNPPKFVKYQDTLSIGIAPVKIKCTDASGASAGFPQGSDFNGRLYIAFNYPDDGGMAPKIVGANLVTRVQ